MSAGDVVARQKVRTADIRIHYRRAYARMREAKGMTGFVKRDTLDVIRRAQASPIRVPRLCGVKKNVGLNHRRTGIAVIRHSQCARTETGTEDRARECH